MSFAVLQSLGNALGIPPARIPIDGSAFISYILPPLVCNLLAALLAVQPRTRALRAALWPLIVLLTIRPVFSVEMSGGIPERRFLNIHLGLLMLSIATRTFHWTHAKEPLVRRLRPANSSPSTIMDALDLISNFRGYGWDWSGRLFVPCETRPTDRMAFVFRAFLSMVVHTLLCGALQRALLSMSPAGIGPFGGGSSIFDDSLPFLVRYLRAGFISSLAAFSIYAVMQMNYDLIAIPAILILGQDPAQWPPEFDAPWRATSLADFWGRRWHQLYRQLFLLLGGYPFSFVLGRAGIVLGSFFASAVVHHIALFPLDNTTEFWRMFVGFGMMAPGILAELAFQKLTGKRVGGFVGWVWTMSWVLLWGTVIVEGFARAGMFRAASPPDELLPVRIPVERWAINLDVWLRSI